MLDYCKLIVGKFFPLYCGSLILGFMGGTKTL